MFGEVYSADQEVESTYVRRGGLPATLDFSFQEAAKGFVAGDGSAQALADVYAKDDLYTTRDTNAGRLPTFLGNHDMGRIGSFIQASGSDDATRLKKDQLAHELMFLTRGQPVVYSGDEQGFTGPGGDKDARQDMFASKTADYLDDDLIGTDRTHAVDNYNTAHPLYQTIASLGALRKANSALRGGVQVTRHAADGVFAASRLDPAQRVEYVVAANSGTTAKTVTIDTWSASTAFRGIYGISDTVQAAGDGKLTVTVPPLAAITLKADKSFKVEGAAPTIKFTSPTDALVPTRTKLAVETTGDPLARVTFAAQVGNGPWQLVGTATNSGSATANAAAGGVYSAYHDLTGLAGGTTVRYKAVVRDSRGKLASATTSIKVGTALAATSPDYAVVHYQRPAGGYDDYGLYVFGDVDPSMTTTWPAGQPFVGEDAYGKFALVKLAPNAKNVGFIVVSKDGVKDVEADRTFDPSQNGEIWLEQGDAAITTTPPAASPDTSTATIHYRRADGDYAGWGLHVWDGAATGTDWASPLPPTGTDSFGPYWKVPLAAGATALKYIIHNGDAKDLPDDQQLTFAEGGHEIWLLAGVSPRVAPVVKKTGSGGVVDVTKASAVWIDRGTIAFQPGGTTDGKVYDLVYAPEGIDNGRGAHRGLFARWGCRLGGTALPTRQRAKFPQLWQYDAFALPAVVGTRYFRHLARSSSADRAGRDRQAALRHRGADRRECSTMSMPRRPHQRSSGRWSAVGRTTLVGVGADGLGRWTCNSSDTVAESAPSDRGDDQRDDRTGESGTVKRTFGVVEGQVLPVPGDGVAAGGTEGSSRPLSPIRTRWVCRPTRGLSQIVDLADPALAPAGWTSVCANRRPSPPSTIQISELSVRDFSIADTTVPVAAAGHLRRVHPPVGSAGMKHLTALADSPASPTCTCCRCSTSPPFTGEARRPGRCPPVTWPSMAPDSDQQQKPAWPRSPPP